MNSSLSEYNKIPILFNIVAYENVNNKYTVYIIKVLFDKFE